LARRPAANPSGGGLGHAAGATVLEAAQLDSNVPDGPLVVENVAQGVAEAPLFALLERGAPLLLTAQLPPSEWPEKLGLALPDLVRIGRWFRACADDALLMGLAVKAFADRQVRQGQSEFLRPL